MVPLMFKKLSHNKKPRQMKKLSEKEQKKRDLRKKQVEAAMVNRQKQRQVRVIGKAGGGQGSHNKDGK